MIEILRVWNGEFLIAKIVSVKFNWVISHKDIPWTWKLTWKTSFYTKLENELTILIISRKIERKALNQIKKSLSYVKVKPETENSDIN